MKSLYGQDVGTSIDFGRDGIVHQAQHPWPPETVVSAGRGVVVRSSSGEVAYRTLFVEVYPPGASFIRGEGATPAECEDRAWVKYQAALNCVPDSGGHVWEARGYRNGAGFCIHCHTFRSGAFTAEELGQFCHVCQAATMWHWEKDAAGDVVFFCQDHMPVTPQPPEGALGRLLAALAADVSASEGGDGQRG